jgi:hypothetical protein
VQQRRTLHHPGNIVETDQQKTPNTYLFNAIEIAFDDYGDDDGLWDSNYQFIYVILFI